MKFLFPCLSQFFVALALLTTSDGDLLAQQIFLVDASKTGNTSATGVITVNAGAWANTCGDLQAAIERLRRAMRSG